MKTKVALSLLLSMIPIGSAHAVSTAQFNSAFSDRVGNGGFAYVCRSPEGWITSARLLDLWEGEELQTWTKDEPVESQISVALAKVKMVSPNAFSFIGNALESLRANMVYVDRALTSTDDAFPPYQPAKGCGYEQVARYEPVLTETGKRGLRINREIYDSPFFTNSDRAALFIHEAVYLADRGFNGATNSQWSRTIVAHLFSESTLPNAIRLTIGAMTGLDFDVSSYEKREKSILAVPNPRSVPVAVRFPEVDGYTAYNVNEAPKDDLYSCSYYSNARTLQIVDTGWVKLETILGTSITGEGGGVQLFSQIVAEQFNTPPSSGLVVPSVVSVSCTRKTTDGRMESVLMKGHIYPTGKAECLAVNREDGSITTSQFCSIYLKSDLVPGSKPAYWAVQVVELVQGEK